MEKRNISCELRTTGSENEEKVIEGYFSVFNSETEIAPGFFEIIDPGAFDETIQNDDIRMLFNHSSDYVLGRNKSGTATFSIDEKGLHGRAVLPNTSMANDAYEMIKRGDISQASFGFDILNEIIDVNTQGKIRYRILKVKLYEVSPVTFPAYGDTEVSARNKGEQNTTRILEMMRQKNRKRLEELRNAKTA